MRGSISGARSLIAGLPPIQIAQRGALGSNVVACVISIREVEGHGQAAGAADPDARLERTSPGLTAFRLPHGLTSLKHRPGLSQLLPSCGLSEPTGRSRPDDRAGTLPPLRPSMRTSG